MANTYALVILAALLAEYVLFVVSSLLNVRSLDPELPADFRDVFDADEYARSQRYTRTRTWFGLIRATISLAAVLGWWQGGGFDWLDQRLRLLGYEPVVTGLMYIGGLGLGLAALGLPFRIYSTFVIEQRYGFNRTTPATFVTDLVKGLLLAILIGGVLLTLVLIFFEWAGPFAWLWCWAAATAFTLAVQFVAPTWILPLFNTFRPLGAGELREAILAYARSVHFPVKDIFVVDGSRRTSKANAFFAGIGRNKRIGLFDTLVEHYSVPELVAVVAHEIGHYKRRHIQKAMALGIARSGAVFFVMSLFLTRRGLFEAFSMTEPSIYAGLVFFGLLFTPVDLVLSMLVNSASRKNEFEADEFSATTTGSGEPLITALKKLTADSLGNLTPHPVHVFLSYSHPPVTKRIAGLRAQGR